MSTVFESLRNNPHCWRIGRKPLKINSRHTRKNEWKRFYSKNLGLLFLLIAFQNHSRARGSLLKFSRTQCRLNCKAGKRRSCKNKDKYKDFIQRPEGAFFKNINIWNNRLLINFAVKTWNSSQIDMKRLIFSKRLDFPDCQSLLYFEEC